MATRGRPPSAKTLVDRQLGRNIKHPILPAGDDFIIPNHSGDLSAGRVDSTPVNDLDPVNKAYVDSNDFWQRVGDVLSPKVAADVNLGDKKLRFGEDIFMFILDLIPGDARYGINVEGESYTFSKDGIFSATGVKLGLSTNPWTTIYTNTLNLGTNTIADGVMTGDWDFGSGSLTAEQITSTDDITMQGHLLNMGDGTDTDMIIQFNGSSFTGKITYFPDEHSLRVASLMSISPGPGLTGGFDVLTISAPIIPSADDLGFNMINFTGALSGDKNVASITGVPSTLITINSYTGTLTDFIAHDATLVNTGGGGSPDITNAYGYKVSTITTAATNRWGYHNGTDANNLMGSGVSFFDGDLIFTSAGSGLVYGTMSIVSNATETAITTQNVYAQITIFDTNGPSNNTSPNHNNDHITITKAGDYKIECCITANSVAGAGATFEFEVKKNNGNVRVGAAHGDRTLAGGGSEAGAITICTTATLAVNDTIELWTKNESNTQNIIIEDASLSVLQVGG